MRPARSAAGAGGPQRHRAAEPAAEPADRVRRPGRRTGGWCGSSLRRPLGLQRDDELPLGAVPGRCAASPCRRGRRPGPRIDWLTPSRPSASAASSSRPSGMPGPSSRTETSTRSGRTPRAAPRRARRARRAAARCRGRRAPPRPARPRSRRGSSTGVPGVATWTPGRVPSAASAAARSALPASSGVGDDRVLRADQASAARPPAPRPAGPARRRRRRARRRDAAPARAPAAPRRGRRAPAGPARPRRRPRAGRRSRSAAIRCSESARKPTIGPPSSSRNDVAVVGLARSSSRTQQVGAGQHRARDQPATQRQSAPPRRAAAPITQKPGMVAWKPVALHAPGTGDQRRDGHRQVGHQQQRPCGAAASR